MKFILNLGSKYFPLPLDVRWLDGKRWELLSPFEYHRPNGEIITVEKGFISDFGSKPPITWFFIGSPTDEGAPAYIPHDKLCSQIDYPKSKADFIFDEALSKLPVPYWKRKVMYFAVRAFHLFRR